MPIPADWDLSGHSGTDREGYFRVDDGESMALEVKWATEDAKKTTAPDMEVRRESYFRALRETAKKKKLTVTTRDTDAPKGVLRDHPERTAAGFTWSGDRKGVGVVWFCSKCRRVTIAQVIGDTSGKGGLGSVSESLLGSLRCHDIEEGQRVWAIYDLVTVVPSDYLLVTAQLMNVYLRLSFARRSARLSVEQWSVANVARKDAYLDMWLAANAKGELSGARYTVSESSIHGVGGVAFTGGPAIGKPMLDVVKEVTQFQRPATRFSAVAWEDKPANKIYLVESIRPGSETDVVTDVATRTRTAG